MDQISVSIWGLAAVLLIAFIGWFFKGPKESAAEMVARLALIESKHHALDVRTAISEARLSSELRHLSNTIDRLIAVIEGNESDHARVSGRHSTLDR